MSPYSPDYLGKYVHIFLSAVWLTCTVFMHRLVGWSFWGSGLENVVQVSVGTKGSAQENVKILMCSGEIWRHLRCVEFGGTWYYGGSVKPVHCENESESIFDLPWYSALTCDRWFVCLSAGVQTVWLRANELRCSVTWTVYGPILNAASKTWKTAL